MKFIYLALFAFVTYSQTIKLYEDPPKSIVDKPLPPGAPDPNQRAPYGEQAKPVKPWTVPVNHEGEPALSDSVKGPVSSVEGTNVSAHNPNSPEKEHKIGSKLKPNTVEVE